MKHDYEAIVLADSISPNGDRLTTMEWTFPRFILAEVNTHRMLSRNSASSRAIPVTKRIEVLMQDPFVPLAFGKNQKGMQAGDVLDRVDADFAAKTWQEAAGSAIGAASTLADLGVHKQHANRLLEPFAWHTAIISATDWDNVWAQRCHPDAQPEFRIVAELAREALQKSTPREVGYDQWHLPLVGEKYGDVMGSGGALDRTYLPWQVSAGRCARVSYLTHDGVRDPEADVLLYERLKASGHMSPLEHPARPMTIPEMRRFAQEGYSGESLGAYCGNFRGWVQLRKMINGERVFQPRAL